MFTMGYCIPYVTLLCRTYIRRTNSWSDLNIADLTKIAISNKCTFSADLNMADLTKTAKFGPPLICLPVVPRSGGSGGK